jgi:NitT/TauT family transport system permease protein
MSAVLDAPGAFAPPRAAARPGRRALWSGRARTAAFSTLSLAACIVLWHLAATGHWDLGVLTFRLVPPPLEVLQAAWDLLHSPRLLQHLGYSLWRVGTGFAAAAVLGIVLGLLIGRLRWARAGLLPPLEVLRPIPAVAWIPLSILMFPSSELSMIFITFVGALFPILLNTVHGAEAVDRRLVAAARSLGTRPDRLFLQVVLPSAAPAIVTGLSIGMGTCWFCLVSAEMISGQYGIGYYTWASYTVQDYASIVVGMLLIGVLGMGSSVLIRGLGRALMPWQRIAEERA